MKWQITFLIAFTMLLAGCGTPSEEIAIGGAFHLSGPGAFWGLGERNGAQLAIEEINAAGGIDGRAITLAIEDCATDPAATTTALRKLIDIDGVPVIVGPTWFGQFAAPIAEESHVAMLSPSSGPSVPRERFFFSLWPTEAQEAVPIAERMGGQGVKTVVIVYTSNDWSTSMKNHFAAAAGELGIEVIAEFPTDGDEDDFRVVLERIRELGPDAIYAPFAFYPSQGAFSKQRAELGIDVPLYSSSGTENPVLLSAFPEIEGTIYPYPERGPGEAAFRDRYVARFGEEPSPSSAYAYDAVMIIADASRAGATTPDGFVAHFASLRDYRGVSNTITFDGDGRVATKPHVLKTVRDGAFVPVES